MTDVSRKLLKYLERQGAALEPFIASFAIGRDATPRVIHLLAQHARAKQWIVRTDGLPDVLLPENLALDYARLVSQRIANRIARPVLLRIWDRLDGFTEELFKPEGAPLDDALGRRQRRVA